MWCSSAGKEVVTVSKGIGCTSSAINSFDEILFFSHQKDDYTRWWCEDKTLGMHNTLFGDKEYF